MPLQYGLNITKSDAQKMLEENDKQQNGIRTWRSLFGNAGLGANAQSDSITSAYTGAIAQAYKANFEQQNAVMSSGLSAGNVKDMLNMTRQELQNTYDTYLQNYANDINNVQSAYDEEVGNIAGALDERAQNFADLYNSAYTYLSEELFGANRTYEDWENTTPIVEGKNSKDPKVVGYEPGVGNEDYFATHGLEWLKDEDGNLRSWEDLGPDLLNTDGTFSDKGKLFFDQLFNARPEGFERTDADGNIQKVRGFDEWLSENNAELRDWWASGDAYNYNFAGSNAGSVKAYAGLDSTDNLSKRYSQETLDAFVENNKGFEQSSVNAINTTYTDWENMRGEFEKNMYNMSTSERKRASMAISNKKREIGENMNASRDEFFKGFDTTISNMQKTLGDDWNSFYDENKELIEKIQSYKTHDFLGNFSDKDIKAQMNKYDEFMNLYKQLLRNLQAKGKYSKPSGF